MKSIKEKKKPKSDLFKHAFVGSVMGLLISLAVMPLFALIISTGLVQESLADSFVVISVIIGGAAAGLYCAGKQGRAVVTAGAASAASYILLVLLITMMTAKRSGQESMILKVMIASVAGGTFGGVLRLSRKKKKSRLRK